MHGASSIPSWPIQRASEALVFVTGKTGHRTRSVTDAVPPPRERVAFARWLERMALASGLDVLEVECSTASTARVLGAVGPALVRLNCDGEERVVAIVGGRGSTIQVIDEDGRVSRVPAPKLAEMLVADGPDRAAMDALVELTGAAGDERQALERALSFELAADAKVAGIFMIEDGPCESFARSLLRSRLGTPLAIAVASHAIGALLSAGSWLALAYASAHASFERAPFALWILLALSALAFRVLEMNAQMELTLRSARIVKRRFLAGCLAAPDGGALGVGDAIARIADARTIESSLAAGGLATVFTLFDLITIPVALQWGLGGPLLGVLLAVAAAAHVWIFVGLLRQRAQWTDGHLKLTEDLLERMLGHRTRMLQQSRDEWHVSEDQMLAQHWRETKRRDEYQAFAAAIPPRLFLLVGLAVVGIAFAFATTPDLTSVVLSVAGVLLGERALQGFSGGLSTAGDIVISGRLLLPLLRRVPRSHAPPLLPESDSSHASGEIVIEAKNIHVEERRRAHPVIERGALVVREGERVLIEGPSGGGKTTLAGVLANLRKSTGGQVLLRGFDVATLGESEWRRRVNLVPQFDDNHLFSSSLLYNIWIGRSWPPNDDDIRECNQICEELGLGELIARMPQGLHQAVGESGWQLSHGEQSRVFIARALLAKPDVLILDEALGTVDPESLERVLRCVLRRSRTLVLVGHP